ncbi:MAG: hypothetical protein JKY46_03575 [Robiginitomaculum sp.]|nr:hypothetical protein [Robiginitomaculum sp.]
MRYFGLILGLFFIFSANKTIAQTRLDLATAILPTHRSAAEGDTISHFAVMINSSTTDTLTNCRLQGTGNTTPNDEQIRRDSFTYQTVDANNNLTGTPNTPVDLPPGAVQHFVFSMDAGSVFGSFGFFVNQTALFRCNNGVGQDITYVNTSSLYYTDLKDPMDALSVAVTPSGDGVLRIATAGGTEAFSIAATNLGSAGANENVVVTPTLDVQISDFAFAKNLMAKNAFSKLAQLSICETNPATGICLAPAAASVTASLGTGVSTFSVFVTTDAETGAALLPQWLRVTVDFVPQTIALNEIAGRTSVALTAPGQLTGSAETFAGLSPGLYSFRMRPNSFNSNGGIRDGEFLVIDPPAIIATGKDSTATTLLAPINNELPIGTLAAGVLSANLFDNGQTAIPITVTKTTPTIQQFFNTFFDMRAKNDLDQPPSGVMASAPLPRTENGTSLTVARNPMDFPGDEVVQIQKSVNNAYLQTFTSNIGGTLSGGGALSGEVRDPISGTVRGTLNLGPVGTTSDLNFIGCAMEIAENPASFAANFVTFLVILTDQTAGSCLQPGDYLMMIYRSVLAETAFQPMQMGTSHGIAVLYGHEATPTEDQGMVFSVEYIF